jgi:hypothetical protein
MKILFKLPFEIPSRTIDKYNNWRENFKACEYKEEKILPVSMTDYFCITLFTLEHLPKKRELKAFPSIIFQASVENEIFFAIVNISPLSFFL